MGDTALDADRLLAETVEATGLDDLGEPTWRDGFERLLDALREEARLNPLGVDIVAGDMRMLLGNRMAIIDWRKQHPEVADGDVVPPVVIVGQACTGTTILYDILAQDLASRVPLTWEVDLPVPPPETATYLTDPRIDEVDAELSGVELLMPGFLAMHPMGGRLAAGVRPHHCVGLSQRHLPDAVPLSRRTPAG